MDLIFPILSAVLQAASFSLDKVILSFKKIDFFGYIGVSFPLIFFINLLIFFTFDPPISRELIYKTFWWLFASVALTIASNVIYYRALKRDKLSEMEVIGLLTALPVIIFSGLAFSDERNYFILIPALIASAAIVWSHLKKGHLLIKKDTLPFLIWSLTMAPLAAAAFRNSLYDAAILNSAYSCLFRGNIYPERKNRPKENYRICHCPSIYRDCPILYTSIKYKNAA